ncbi:MAG TPA: hypothetical protein VHG93_01900 [Longimicrobium sp.]|nr:hypothetical protein [Longimicrobium sp.]
MAKSAAAASPFAPDWAVTPDALQYLLRDLSAATTLWQRRTERAAATHAQAGRGTSALRHMN